MLLWHRQPIILQSKHVALDGFPNVCNSSLPSLALRDATRKARTLGHPEAIITGVNERLSHDGRIGDGSGKLNSPRAPRHKFILHILYDVMDMRLGAMDLGVGEQLVNAGPALRGAASNAASKRESGCGVC
jgi:hypothetical protein